jgi:uncharacterized protein
VQTFLLFARRHARLIVCGAIALAIVSTALASRVSFDPNILRLLPQRSPAVRQFQRFLQDFGSLDQLYVVFDADDGIANHAELVEAYVESLRAAPEIAAVDAQLFEPGKDWSYLGDRSLYLMDADEARGALARFRPPRLDRELEHARGLLSLPSAQIKGLVQQDPLGLLSILRDRMSRQKGFGSFDPSQEGYVSGDGRSRMILVRPKGAPFDTAFCTVLFQRLAEVETAARRSVAESDPEARAVGIHAAGAYRISLEAERLIRSEAVRDTIGSLVLLLAVVFLVFRSGWIMVFGLVPLGLAALLTLGINAWILGTLSPSTSGFAAMLFGLGIDAVILVYVRYLEEVRAGRPGEEATGRLAGTAWSVVLANVTTAATFGALIFVDFPTLRDLGSLVALGILICCALTLVLLPALLSLRPPVRTPRTVTAAWLGRLVTRRASAILWIGLAATVALAFASTRLRLDAGVDRLQAQTEGARLEREIVDRFSLPRDVLLVLNDGPDLEALLETDERLQRALASRAPSTVASGVSLVLPSERSQAAVSHAIAEAGLTPDSVRSDLASAARRVGFRGDAFDPFMKRLPRLLDPNARVSYEGLSKHGLDSIVSRFVVRRGGGYETATYLYSRQASDFAQVRQIAQDVDPHLQLTGLPVINAELGGQFFPQFLKAMAIGTLAVMALVYVVFRTIRHTLLAMLPTALAFIWSAGILASLGIELDLFSLFAGVTFIGIAVDYGIYVLYRYVFEQPCTVEDVLRETGAAIAVACLTALIGFGTLISSSYAPLRVFGIVSVISLTSCLLASLLFLPALLVRAERWSRSAG